MFRNKHLNYVLYTLPLVIPNYLLINFQTYETNKMLINNFLFHIRRFVDSIIIYKRN